MNHLGCDGSMRVVFDAGDAKLEDDEDDEVEAQKVEYMQVDIGSLRGTGFPLASRHDINTDLSMAQIG